MAIVIKSKPAPKPLQLTAKTADHQGKLDTSKPKPKKTPTEFDASGKPIPDDLPFEDDGAKVSGTQAVGHVNKKFKDGTETDDQIKVGPVKSFLNAPATVGLSMAVTRNLGNYESVKMMVSLHLPCENTEEGIAAAFDEAKGWVDTRVELLNQEVNDQLAG